MKHMKAIHHSNRIGYLRKVHTRITFAVSFLLGLNCFSFGQTNQPNLRSVQQFDGVTVLRPIEVLGRATVECREIGDENSIFGLSVFQSPIGTQLEVKIIDDLKKSNCKAFRYGPRGRKSSAFLIDNKLRVTKALPVTNSDLKKWTLAAPIPYQKTTLSDTEKLITSSPDQKFGATECWPLEHRYEVQLNGAKHSFVFAVISENNSKIGVNLAQFKADCRNWGKEESSGFSTHVASVSGPSYNLPKTALVFDQTFGFAFLVREFKPEFCLSVPDLKLRYLLVDVQRLKAMISDSDDQDNLFGGSNASEPSKLASANRQIARKILLATKDCKQWIQ